MPTRTCTRVHTQRHTHRDGHRAAPLSRQALQTGMLPPHTSGRMNRRVNTLREEVRRVITCAAKLGFNYSKQSKPKGDEVFIRICGVRREDVSATLCAGLRCLPARDLHPGRNRAEGTWPAQPQPW